MCRTASYLSWQRISLSPSSCKSSYQHDIHNEHNALYQTISRAYETYVLCIVIIKEEKKKIALFLLIVE